MVRLTEGWRNVHKWALHNLFSSKIIFKSSNKCIKNLGRVSVVTKPLEDHGVDEKISKRVLTKL